MERGDEEERGERKETYTGEEWQRKLINDIPSSQLPSIISNREDLSQHVLRLYKQGKPSNQLYHKYEKLKKCRTPREENGNMQKSLSSSSSVSSLLEAEKTLETLKRKVLEQEREMNELREELDKFNSRASERRETHETYMRMMGFIEEYGLIVDLDPEKLAVDVDDEIVVDIEEKKPEDALGMLGLIGKGKFPLDGIDDERKREIEDEILVKEHLRRLKKDQEDNDDGENDTNIDRSRSNIKRINYSNIYTLVDEDEDGKGKGMKRVRKQNLFSPLNDKDGNNNNNNNNIRILRDKEQNPTQRKQPLRVEEFLARLPKTVIKSSGTTIEDKHMKVVEVRSSIEKYLNECKEMTKDTSKARNLDE